MQKGEIECLASYNPMPATSQLWTKHMKPPNSKGKNPTAVFTRESKPMAQDQDQVEFASNSAVQQTLPHKFGFVNNFQDLPKVSTGIDVLIFMRFSSIFYGRLWSGQRETRRPTISVLLRLAHGLTNRKTETSGHPEFDTPRIRLLYQI